MRALIAGGRLRRVTWTYHANGDRDYTPHDMASGDHMGRTSADQARPYHWHTSGGYALRHGRL